MKGIVLSTIAYFIIALVTIALILTLISMKVSPSVRNTLCSVLRGMRGLLPLPDYMRPSLPGYCREEHVYIETKEIITKDPDRIEFLIASHVIACWEKTGRLDVGRDTLCYELVLSGVNHPGLTEGDVNQILSDEGYTDILDWNTDSTITVARSIGISYDSTSKRIEVS